MKCQMQIPVVRFNLFATTTNFQPICQLFLLETTMFIAISLESALAILFHILEDIIIILYYIILYIQLYGSSAVELFSIWNNSVTVLEQTLKYNVK